MKDATAIFHFGHHHPRMHTRTVPVTVGFDDGERGVDNEDVIFRMLETSPYRESQRVLCVKINNVERAVERPMTRFSGEIIYGRWFPYGGLQT